MLAFHYRPCITPYAPPTWADGTDAEIAEAVAKADAGEIDLSDYWSVGDERTVHLSAMTAGDGLNSDQPEQDVVLVIMDTGEASGYKDVNDKIVNFVVGQKNCISSTGKMNLTNTTNGSWNGCVMRTGLNNKYYNALPATFRACFKQFKSVTAQTYNGSTNQTSQDYVALFAEKEIYGTRNLGNVTEGNALKQIKYYETASNKIKRRSDVLTNWWLRSLDSRYNDCFLNVNSAGSLDYNYASSNSCIAPFGCI